MAVRWRFWNAKLKLPLSGLIPVAADDRYEQRRVAAAGFPSSPERWLSPGFIEDHGGMRAALCHRRRMADSGEDRYGAAGARVADEPELQGLPGR